MCPRAKPAGGSLRGPSLVSTCHLPGTALCFSSPAAGGLISLDGPADAHRPAPRGQSSPCVVRTSLEQPFLAAERSGPFSGSRGDCLLVSRVTSGRSHPAPPPGTWWVLPRTSHPGRFCLLLKKEREKRSPNGRTRVSTEEGSRGPEQ